MMYAGYVERLTRAEDKFAFVLSDPLVFQLLPDPTRLQALWQELNSADLLDHDRVAMDLAVRYLSRYVQQPTDAVAEFADRIATTSESKQNRMRARLLSAAIKISREDYPAARESFALCVAESRLGEDHLAYALGCMGLAGTLSYLGQPSEAERYYLSALETLARYEFDVLSAFVSNDLAVLKKNVCDYSTSVTYLNRARQVFISHDLDVALVKTTKNLGITCFRLGDWKSARRWFSTVDNLLAKLRHNASLQVYDLRWSFCTPGEHLLIVQRRFGEAEEKLRQYLDDADVPPRTLALVHEFLGELYAECGNYEAAEKHLQIAQDIATRVAPHGDVMSEVLRRQAQRLVAINKWDEARIAALHCVGLSRRIGDKYEFAAALRVLGEVYSAERKLPRAAACFKTAVTTLKSIHECYELMRTLYAQGKFLAATKPDEAEIALLEARQLSKKLELEYYQALIAIAMTDTLGPQERFEEAQTWLAEATSLRDHLEGVDRDRVEAELRRAANDLQKLITRASVKSAETLKTICRVYEDARFPFEDMRADLAYQVAQSINAESLFVIGKSGTGYRVPITYNISMSESKEIVRRLERILKTKALLNVSDEPQILQTMEGRTLLAVPCREDESIARVKKNGDGFVACARFEMDVTPGPRQIELFCASAEALARIIEEEDVRPARKLVAVDEEASDEDVSEESARPRHPRGSFSNILTIDSEMIKLIRTAERAAGSVAPILLEGETGVGKELFARAIHGASQRKDGPFVAINAGGMSVHLLESELFGHVKGAFTDAGNDRTGLIDTARGGTLFFDEVGEMGEEMQVKLLRLMENGEYRRLGESSIRKADVRVISATNRDLKKDAERGVFRRDLYYRLSPLKLTIPPLRMRASDIQLMTRYFLRECAALNGIADRYIEIDVKAMEALELYDWPGNVRELHNEILRVVSLIGRGDLVRFTMLSEHIKEFLKTKKRGDGLLDRSVEQYERRLILDALEKNDWNKLRTADAIGIPRTTLLAKLKRMNIATKL